MLTVVESKVENRKKKRAFRSAVSLELDIEKHILRIMKGRKALSSGFEILVLVWLFEYG